MLLRYLSVKWVIDFFEYFYFSMDFKLEGCWDLSPIIEEIHEASQVQVQVKNKIFLQFWAH